MALKHLLLLGAIALVGCRREQWDDCITSTGSTRTETRELQAFDAIEVKDRIDLVLEARPAGSVAIEGGANLLGQVITEVKDGTLQISNEMRCRWVRSFKPRITVHVPIGDLCRVTLRGTGDLRCADTLRCDYFLLEQWGAEGSTELKVNVDRLDIALHTGAGDALVSGLCASTGLYCGIMAPLDARALRADTVRVNNSGVADVRCWAVHHLEAEVRSAGDVYYRGDPDVYSSVTGSGRLIKE